MKLLIERIIKTDVYTIGNLYIDNQYFCDTLEDKDRGLTQSMSLDEISKIKVYNETAIPIGEYKISIDVISPKFSKKEFYIEVCNGKVPRILDVPGFSGVLIHVGDGPKAQDLTSGCVLIGENIIEGQLSNGKETFINFYNKLKEADEIMLTVK